MSVRFRFQGVLLEGMIEDPDPDPESARGLLYGKVFEEEELEGEIVEDWGSMLLVRTTEGDELMIDRTDILP